ncbi:MAG TPA: protein-L-isoaspartate O-methyltransferase, partial [Candidatus Syntrophoarchaeum butanivorans]|nr:protein-L-isoaspartate O-methyltransferase [Candidatus Syntrophoarchaeum butanivorans]
GYENVKIFVGDGSLGLPEFAPYDRINVTCAAPSIPPPLLDQLRVGGRMVIPIGRYMQELYLVEKREDGIHREIKGDVVFVPLIGKYGFRE